MIPSGVRVWLAVCRTDMRKGMNGRALQVQQVLGRDPHAGDLYVFRGARGDLIKIVWHDGIGMSLYAKRLENPGSSGVGLTTSQRAALVMVALNLTKLPTRVSRDTCFMLSYRSHSLRSR